MNESKAIKANASSIIDLKAELLRKQESFRLKKLSESQQQLNNNNDNNLYSINNNLINNKYKLGKRIREKVAKSHLKLNEKKSSIDFEENNKLNEQKIEEEMALKKSRQMLEKKSKLYEKLSNDLSLEKADNEEFDELDDRILVNFQQKAIDKQIKDKNNLLEKNETIFQTNYDNNSDEEWTEFVDSLGRSRKCLKKDLQHFIDIDKETFQKNSFINSESNQSNSEQSVDLSANNELLSNDLKRELDRREWETNAYNELNCGANESETDGSVHYQNVEYNEIRDHGVAYYSFSKDSHQREEQMNLLNNLRQQTKSHKIAKQKLKQKRKLLLRERLAKIAQRKGISVDAMKLSDSEDEEEPEPEPALIEEPPRSKPQTIREWDIGKEDLLLQSLKPKLNLNTTYIEEKRSERNTEFGPPSSYNKNKFRDHFKDKTSHYKQQNFKTQEIPAKAININNSKSFDNNIRSTTSSPEPDVNQIISNALSFFRNNSK